MHLSLEDRYYLKLKAVYLYYIEDKTQAEISELLHVSRPTLIRLIKEARDDGLVSITINDTRHSRNHIELERELCSKLNLTDARIVNSVSDTQDAINNSIGTATARYLVSLLKTGLVIGIGWGNTLQTMIKHIQADPRIKNLEFVSLIGGLNTEDGKTYSMFANTLCESIASNYSDSTVAMLHAPLVVRTKNDVQALLNSSSLSITFAKMQKLDVAVVGIDGDPLHSTTLRLDKSLNKRRDEIIAKQCVGNICGRFYTKTGKMGFLDFEDRLISIKTDELKATPIVIGAAGGKHKIESIIGASRASLFNILITDERTAEELERNA
ncbi:MAG: helix-turn-helix domain-containing protein [Clostridiales Family XIII bacterium]|jgi:deoxyribonucleoside regulator|nr:helix-turn-helix domain-containing protein [Clostridiales Family XIII bacterium]